MTSGGVTGAVFLDRDGTVIEDRGYLRDPGAVRFLSGAIDGLRRLHDAGWPLVIVSNQSGVGRGIITATQAAAIHDRFTADLAEAGIALAGAYYCPHAPDRHCACRKPEPEMLLRAARELTLDLPSSVMVGDKTSDVEAGRRAGTRKIRFAPAGGERSGADRVARSWSELVEEIVAPEVWA